MPDDDVCVTDPRYDEDDSEPLKQDIVDIVAMQPQISNLVRDRKGRSRQHEVGQRY